MDFLLGHNTLQIDQFPTCWPMNGLFVQSMGWGVSSFSERRSHHRIIMKFSGVITMDRSDVHAKGQGQRSKVKVTEVNTQLSRFRTPVWIHIWQWYHAHSWKQHRRGALLFLAATKQLEDMNGSVRLSVCPSLRHTFLTMLPSSYHHEIFRS